jgi:hypothetical protein
MSKRSSLLGSIFEEPVRANISWRDTESLLRSLGAELTQGRGSRIRVALNGVRAVFHEPDPQKEMGKAMVRSVRAFLTEAGIVPDIEE